jgi:hypothetical protein
MATITAAGISAFEGKRVKSATSPKVYLILDGKLRLYPDAATHNNLHADFSGVLTVDIDDLPFGPAFPAGACLVKPDTGPAVYLISDKKKRWVNSPAAMAKYAFTTAGVITVPHILLDSIVSGPDIGS